jgi:hypothetical protein
MGIGMTLQQVEGWEGQYERMLRSYQRATAAAGQNNGQDEMDFVLVLFEQSWTLRNWVHEVCPEARAALETLFRNNLELRLCRDIANGFKHMSLSRPSVDRAFSIVFEYNPRGGREGDMVVLAGNGHKFQFLELAGRCMALWREFVEREQLRRSSAAAPQKDVYVGPTPRLA